ncbi:hypothetical protein BD311DRAFT_751150 [Dichomitus squalens]|uniref:Uncharacterized protein n=1 Tax=Dichomitus squalens TaxID=114155 RepID=A0A4Q9MVQ9_9APHY|nr:hypothetical protein BD311DRAFT_751150 [Dichomitus squalens]
MSIPGVALLIQAILVPGNPPRPKLSLPNLGRPLAYLCIIGSRTSMCSDEPDKPSSPLKLSVLSVYQKVDFGTSEGIRWRSSREL